MDISLELIKEIAHPSPTKIVLLVIDGLGGLPNPETARTELETAKTPNLDKLVTKGGCGLTDPVGRGITPGSAPGHLALFGYDPVTFNIGRGTLEAVGIDFDLKPGDVAARGNFCTVDEQGLIADRRAGVSSSLPSSTYTISYTSRFSSAATISSISGSMFSASFHTGTTTESSSARSPTMISQAYQKRCQAP